MAIGSAGERNCQGKRTQGEVGLLMSMTISVQVTLLQSKTPFQEQKASLWVKASAESSWVTCEPAKSSSIHTLDIHTLSSASLKFRLTASFVVIIVSLWLSF